MMMMMMMMMMMNSRIGGPLLSATECLRCTAVRPNILPKIGDWTAQFSYTPATRNT